MLVCADATCSPQIRSLTFSQVTELCTVSTSPSTIEKPTIGQLSVDARAMHRLVSMQSFIVGRLTSSPTSTASPLSLPQSPPRSPSHIAGPPSPSSRSPISPRPPHRSSSFDFPTPPSPSRRKSLTFSYSSTGSGTSSPNTSTSISVPTTDALVTPSLVSLLERPTVQQSLYWSLLISPPRSMSSLEASISRIASWIRSHLPPVSSSGATTVILASPRRRSLLTPAKPTSQASRSSAAVSPTQQQQPPQSQQHQQQSLQPLPPPTSPSRFSTSLSSTSSSSSSKNQPAYTLPRIIRDRDLRLLISIFSSFASMLATLINDPHRQSPAASPHSTHRRVASNLTAAIAASNLAILLRPQFSNSAHLAHLDVLPLEFIDLCALSDLASGADLYPWLSSSLQSTLRALSLPSSAGTLWRDTCQRVSSIASLWLSLSAEFPHHQSSQSISSLIPTPNSYTPRYLCLHSFLQLATANLPENPPASHALQFSLLSSALCSASRSCLDLLLSHSPELIRDHDLTPTGSSMCRVIRRCHERQDQEFTGSVRLDQILVSCSESALFNPSKHPLLGWIPSCTLHHTDLMRYVHNSTGALSLTTPSTSTDIVSAQPSIQSQSFQPLPVMDLRPLIAALHSQSTPKFSQSVTLRQLMSILLRTAYLDDTVRSMLTTVPIQKPLTPAQLSELTQLFASFDMDGSGEIELHELKDACMQMNLPLSDPARFFTHVFEDLDIDRSGTVTSSEFISLWRRQWDSLSNFDSSLLTSWNPGEVTLPASSMVDTPSFSGAAVQISHSVRRRLSNVTKGK